MLFTMGFQLFYEQITTKTYSRGLFNWRALEQVAAIVKFDYLTAEALTVSFGNYGFSALTQGDTVAEDEIDIGFLIKEVSAGGLNGHVVQSKLFAPYPTDS